MVNQAHFIVQFSPLVFARTAHDQLRIGDTLSVVRKQSFLVVHLLLSRVGFIAALVHDQCAAFAIQTKIACRSLGFPPDAADAFQIYITAGPEF